MHSHDQKKMVSIHDLVSMIEAQSDIEGITILGGEPLEQCHSVLSLVQEVKALNYTVVLYSGFEPEEIQTSNEKLLVQSADIVIIGRYREELRSTHLLWRGSTKQQVQFHNEHYRRIYNGLSEMNQAEIHISKDGHITITGYPDQYLLNEVLS